MDLAQVRNDLHYIQGMLEGSASDSLEHKAMLRLIEVVDTIVEQVQDFNERLEDIEEYVDVLDEDLDAVERDNCDEDESDTLLLHCPQCGQDIYIVEEELEDGKKEIYCSNCNATVLKELSDEELDDL